MSRIRGPQDRKEYGQKDLLGSSKPKKSIFSGPLFPKGTAGIFPKYDKALKSKKIASLEDAMIIKPTKPKNPERASNKPSSVKVASAKVKVNGDKKPQSFTQAFKAAKGQKTFTFEGKSYARVTKDELKDKGFKSLRAYLNAQKTTRVAKK